MLNGTHNMKQTIGYDQPMPEYAPGELNRLATRLENILGGLRSVTSDLTRHADRLHGANATNGVQADQPRPVRSGSLGTVEDLIDCLSDQIEVLYIAANRNTNLA